MFGAGGLFATQVLDLHGGQAAIVGVVAGVAGAALAGGLFGILKRSESGEPFKLADLVGDSVYVSVAIPATPLREHPGQARGPDPRVRGDVGAGHPGGPDGAGHGRRRQRPHRRGRQRPGRRCGTG